MHSGKISNQGELLAAERQAGVKDRAEQTRITEKILWTPLQYQAAKMPLDKAMLVFDLANDKERVQLAPLLATRIQRYFDAGKLDSTTTSRYVKLVMPWYQKAMAPPPAAAPGPAMGAGVPAQSRPPAPAPAPRGY